MLLDALNLNSVIETADSADFTDSSKTLKLGGSQRLCRLMKAGIGVLDDMLRMFPNLAARADTVAGVLSSGEQQMLTICRTLMGDPELVMIDEPTEGLAPIIVQQVGDLIAEIARRGVAILLIEQKLSIAMRISHRVYVMGRGRIVFEGTPAQLNANQTVRHEWLEV